MSYWSWCNSVEGVKKTEVRRRKSEDACLTAAGQAGKSEDGKPKPRVKNSQRGDTLINTIKKSTVLKYNFKTKNKTGYIKEANISRNIDMSCL